MKPNLRLLNQQYEVLFQARQLKSLEKVLNNKRTSPDTFRVAQKEYMKALPAYNEAVYKYTLDLQAELEKYNDIL